MKTAKDNGLQLTLFVGGNLQIGNESGKMDSVRAYISGNKVYVRADHPVYTADQLMHHEAGHAKIARGEIDPQSVRDRIDREYSQEHTDYLSEIYAEAYEGTDLSADEIWEEVICDSLGDMNIFRDVDGLANTAGVLLNEVKESTEAETQIARGPPAEDTNVPAKMSRDSGYKKVGRQVWRQIQRERMSRYGSHFDTMPRMDTFYAHDMLFVIENFDESSFGVVERIDPATQLEKANIVLEVMRDGSIEYASEYRRRVENLRRWQRQHARNSVHAENTGTGGKNAGASARHGSTRNGGAAAGKGSGTDKVKPKNSQDPYRQRPPAEDTNVGGKMSRDLNKQQKSFFRHFDGKILVTDSLTMSGLEKKIVASAIKTGYAVLDEDAVGGYVRSSDGKNNYVYTFIVEGAHVRVTDVLDYELDADAIEIIERRTANGAPKTGNRSDRGNGSSRLEERNSLQSGAIASQARTSGGNEAVSEEKRGGDTQRNIGRGTSDRANGGTDGTEAAAEKPKRSIKELSDRLDYLTKQLKTANLSKEQKTKIRREQNAIRKELKERIVPYGADGPGKMSWDKLIGREFPTYNISHSDANELATRWAHQNDVQAGDQKLFSYHGSWYLVEAFENADMGYQIVEKLTKQQYNAYVKEKRENGNVSGVQEDLSKLSELDRERERAGGRKRSADLAQTGQRGKDFEVRTVGKEQNEGRQTAGDGSRDLQSSRASIEDARLEFENSRVLQLSVRIQRLDAARKKAPKGSEKRKALNKEIRALREELSARMSGSTTGKASRELESLEELRQQNVALQKQVEYWKGQTKRTTRETATLRQADIDKLARRIVKDYSSTLKAEDIVDPLKKLGEYILRDGDGRNELTWPAVKEQAVNIARDIAQNATTLRDDTWREYSDLRQYLRTTDIIQFLILPFSAV